MKESLAVSVTASIVAAGVRTDTRRRRGAPRSQEVPGIADGAGGLVPHCAPRHPDRSRRRHDAELRHEARAALLAVEAAASGLTHHQLLTAEQIDELSGGLVAEVRRLLALLDGRSSEAATFDLHAAIAPVLTCARAHGLDVTSSVPGGIHVSGSADSTAQVLRALLTNAQQHAPGSPVEVRVSRSDDGVVLYVEDRGPGDTALLISRARSVGRPGRTPGQTRRGRR